MEVIILTRAPTSLHHFERNITVYWMVMPAAVGVAIAPQRYSGWGLQAEHAVTMWVFNAWAAAQIKQIIFII